MITGKKIVLTGATGGVGSAMARALRKAGANLLLVSEDQHKLLALVKSLNGTDGVSSVESFVLDLSDLDHLESNIRDLKARLKGRVDVLINNAGIGYHGLIETIKLQELREVFAVNALAPMMLTSRLLPYLQKSDAGHIINTSSILGSRAMMRTAAYTSSKHALSGFSKVLRPEAASRGVRVTVIEPGAIDTSFINRTNDPEAKEFFGKRKLVKLSPDVIAEWVIKILESDPTVCPEVIQIMPRDQII